MHDIKYIRENPEKFNAWMVNRGEKPVAELVLEADSLNREAITHLEEAKQSKNKTTKLAETVKASGDQKQFEQMRLNLKKVKDTIIQAEINVKNTTRIMRELTMMLPNSPLEDVPIGKDENDNKELHRWGTIPSFDYTPQEHFNIPSVSKGMDFETAGKLSGSRFVLLSGAIARIHRALAQFMLDLHTEEHELIEVNTPVIVNSLPLYGTGQIPKFAEDCYKLHNNNEGVENAVTQWLIPTAEVPLSNIVAEMTLSNDQLPQRYCAHSLCFRKEAGSAGRDTKGMLRQHQFEKVEMVSITHPEKSRKELDRMTTCAQNVLERLELPYRTVVLCTGDMGFSAQRTHDIEVWLPGQNRYREISSVSVCGDFQARRMNARFREKDGDKPQFVHTLNGSGVAVGRCLIAVLENGQQEDGSVKLPKALHPYLGGKDTINPDGILEKAT